MDLIEVLIAIIVRTFRWLTTRRSDLRSHKSDTNERNIYAHVSLIFTWLACHCQISYVLKLAFN
ncbi:hypothetical protein CGI09_00910 [Vibrio parahaemolyticus]|nr:hypothetical protein CGI95_00920 [Vibrio parahaemolyticus]TOH49639.1 hypothetical protein CGI81_06455 [Vibrio parahaemolyticus]TOH92288.1 hypothetical protein CGI71_03610 [Vibrio parahaemolyticus]TOL08662.1 hypothetical protein CGI09_00910 [Vibrio parahaemolyticus]TOP88386.1 hypothetical protein CGH08_07050 [Vibrio parahaemolyticus]